MVIVERASLQPAAVLSVPALVQTIACQKCQPERKCVMLAPPTLTQPCDTQSVLDMTVDRLQHHCHQETRRFINQQPHDPRFCLELLRRALTSNDVQAWYVIYTTTNARWVNGYRRSCPLLLATANYKH